MDHDSAPPRPDFGFVLAARAEHGEGSLEHIRALLAYRLGVQSEMLRVHAPAVIQDHARAAVHDVRACLDLAAVRHSVRAPSLS